MNVHAPSLQPTKATDSGPYRVAFGFSALTFFFPPGRYSCSFSFTFISSLSLGVLDTPTSFFLILLPVVG